MRSIRRRGNIWEYKKLKVTGIFSHLCAADEKSQKEKDYTKEQIKRFELVVNQLKKEGKTGFSTHLQGSYGILNYPECRFDYARPGIVLYGLFSRLMEWESREKCSNLYSATEAKLRPVLSLKTRVESVKILERIVSS